MRHKHSMLGHDYTYLEFHLHGGGPLMSSSLVERRQVWEGRSRGDPIGNRCGYCAIVSPVDNEMIVVGGLCILRRGFCRRFWWWSIWSCPLNAWSFGFRLDFGPSIAGSRPGDSGRGGGSGVLPVHFSDESLEFIVLCSGNITFSQVTCFVETVAETFSADEPVGAHECLVVPFRAVLRASPSKIFLPVFVTLH